MNKLPFWFVAYRYIYSVFFPIFEVFVDFLYEIFWKSTPSKPTTLSNEDDEIFLLSAVELGRRIRLKQLKSVDVVRSYIDRLKKVQPDVNAYTDERFEEAIKEAEAVDALVNSTDFDPKDAEKNKVFLGVPFTTKNAMAVRGLRHDCGQHCRKNLVADEDGETVESMKRAGAIVTCVTNVPEMCAWIETYNKLHGRTNNPVDVRRTCGGSSGGEASVIASGGSLLGIGSDVAGSIRIPAYCCGIYGHRPSPLIVPSKGHYPQAMPGMRPFPSIGPMSRFASDLLPMFKIMCSTSTDVQKLHLDEKVNLKELKVYYIDDFNDPFTSRTSNDIKNAIRTVCDHLESITQKKPEKLHIEELEYATGIYTSAVSTKVSAEAFLEKMTGDPGANFRSELFNWILGRSNLSLPSLFVTAFKKIEPRSESQIYKFMTDQGEKLQQKLHTILDDKGIIICPVMPTVATYHTQTFFKSPNFIYTGIFNRVGMPSTSCPTGFDCNGLPLGVQVVANTHQDRVCLAVAEELERRFGKSK